MSHCIACDRLLTDREAARTHRITHEEIGLCDKCLTSVEEVQYIPLSDPVDEELSEQELDSLMAEFPDLQFDSEEDDD